MFLMASNLTTEKINEGTSETKTKPQPFSLSGFFNRNGHPKTPAAPVKPKGPPKSILREYFESAVVTVIMALFGMTFIVQAVKVPTGSMQKPNNIRNHLLLNKFFFSPGQCLPFFPH